MPLLYRLLLGLFLFVGVRAVATADCGDDCVPVNEWRFNLALGIGLRENPLVGGEHTPLIVMPEVSWYGERFFINNLELGATLFENRRHQLNAIVTPGYQQMHFNRWDPFNFFDRSSGLAGTPLSVSQYSAQTYNVSITYSDAFTDRGISGGAPMSGSAAGDSAVNGYPRYEVSGVSAVTLNGESIDLSARPASRTGASDNTIDLTLANGRLVISGLSPQDQVQLASDRSPEALPDDRAGTASDFENITLVPAAGPAPGDSAAPVSSQHVRHRRMAGLFGVEYLWSLPRLQLHAQVLGDFTGVHDGHELRLAAILPWHVNDNRFALTLGTNYQSRRVLDYYYGVRADDNVSIEQQFTAASAGFSRMMRLDWQKPITPRWSLRGLVKYTTLAPEIRPSPLVDKNYSGAIFIGGVYHF